MSPAWHIAMVQTLRMSWTPGAPLTDEHRARLLDVGVDPEVLSGLVLRQVTGGPLADWWAEWGNALYAAAGVDVPLPLVRKLCGLPFADTLIVVASPVDNLVSLLVSGEGATVFIGPGSELTAGEIFCGGGSSVVLNGDVTATRCAVVDARNGGSIVAGRGQLWAANVYVATDDMHRLEDAATGARINPYGAHIRLGRHVWLGRDAVVTGHVDIGDNAVVGLRSLVRGQKVPANTAVAGTPARVIREGVTWREDDTP